MTKSQRQKEGAGTLEGLREEYSWLEAALAAEHAAAVVTLHGLPPSLLQALVGLDPEAQERRGQEIPPS